MRSLSTALVVALLLAPRASALAQEAPREARAGAATVAAEDTECWASPEVQCAGVDRAEVVVASPRAVRVRVVSVEVRADAEGATWENASGLHVITDADLARSEPPHPGRDTVRARPGRDTLRIYFDRVAAYEGEVRVTLEVGGRRVVVGATHRVVAIHE